MATESVALLFTSRVQVCLLLNWVETNLVDLQDQNGRANLRTRTFRKLFCRDSVKHTCKSWFVLPLYFKLVLGWRKTVI